MKTIYELIRYHFHSYFKSSKFVMPVVILAVVLYCMYTIMPVGIVDSFSISCVYLFLIMVWAGLSYNTLEEPVSEQLMILRVRSETSYYLSCSMFLILLGMLAALISTCLLYTSPSRYARRRSRPGRLSSPSYPR